MKKIIFTLAAVGMLSACSLDETPYGFYSSDNFYKTEEDAESGLMYAYNALNYPNTSAESGIWATSRPKRCIPNRTSRETSTCCSNGPSIRKPS